MELIAPLSSGIVGATSGTVRIYRRGTSTRASLYSDFEGADSLTNTSDLSLDAYGRLEVYVNENVDVTVFSSTGTSVATFTVGSAAPAIEYQGQSFSGVDYETANTGTGAGYPVSLQTLLNLWYTSAGATNFNVLASGASSTLQSAFKLGIFYNVKDSTYGALGDNSTDDTTAIQAAISAAAAAGGGIVFFPKGTYRTTAALSLTYTVSLLGVGATSSVITLDHATANVITITDQSGGYSPHFIEGLRIVCAQANTGKLLERTGTDLCIVRRCYFGGAYANGSKLVELGTNGVSGISAEFLIEDCFFAIPDANTTGSAIVGTGSTVASRGVTINRCYFTTPATCNSTAGIVSGKGVTINDCTFNCAASTSGTFSCYQDSTAVSAAVVARITDCKFINGGGATVTAMTLGTYSSVSTFYEAGNFFGSSITAYSYTCAVASLGALVTLATRETRELVSTTAATPYTLQMKQYGILKVTTTVAGTTTFNPETPPDGAKGSVWITNGNGSARDFTLQTATFSTQTTCTAVGAGGGATFMYTAHTDPTATAATNVICNTPMLTAGVASVP